MKTLRILLPLIALTLGGCKTYHEVGIASNYSAPNRVDVAHITGAPAIHVGSTLCIGGFEYTVKTSQVFSPNSPFTDSYYQLSTTPALKVDPTGRIVYAVELASPYDNAWIWAAWQQSILNPIFHP